MVETILSSPKKPAVVILAAVVDFIFSVFFFLTAFIALLGLFVAQVSQAMTNQMTTAYQSAPPLSTTALCLMVAIPFAILGLLVFFLGLGVLKGRKGAYYGQIFISLFSLMFILVPGPNVLSILNLLILVFFFLRPARDYFKV